MKILGGGEWSRGDAIAFIGVFVAVVGCIAAVLAIPGMPKLLHLDSEGGQPSKVVVPPQVQAPARQILKPVTRTNDVTSGQVNFGCDQTLSVETPVVSFGLNPRNVEAQPGWSGVDNAKSHNQNSMNIEDPTDHKVTGIKAVGTITGLDPQSILGVKNCPGGGHGELKLHVTWTEDQ
jgi:hypothetical protein